MSGLGVDKIENRGRICGQFVIGYNEVTPMDSAIGPEAFRRLHADFGPVQVMQSDGEVRVGIMARLNRAHGEEQ